MGFFNRLLCGLGLHRWAIWCRPELNHYTDTGGAYLAQARPCEHCGLAVVRIL